MAIVVASPKTDALDKPELPPLVFHDPADLSTMRWTATKRTNEKIMSKLQGNGKKLDWTSDFLAAARANATESGNEQNLYGVRTPKPIGIITYEDIIDAILQKTSRDEKDFFDRVTTSPPTKAQHL
jgi:metal transporter CNNM